MKRPKLPKKGSVAVLSSSYFEEFKPELATVCDNVEDAEEWIKQKLLEEPGDLFMVCPILSVHWASVRRHKIKISGGK